MTAVTHAAVPRIVPRAATRVGRRHHRRTLVATGILMALLAALIATDRWLAASPGSGQPSAERVAEALAAAGAAEEAHHDLRGGYTSDQGALFRTGWQPTAGVEVSVLAASPTGFCLAAGPAGDLPTVWLTETWMPLTEPCG